MAKLIKNMTPQGKKMKRLRQKADKLWQFAVYKKWHKRNNDLCECCNQRPSSVGHHYWTKGNNGHLRYDLDVGVLLCFHCHQAIHKSEPALSTTIANNLGKKWYDKLYAKKVDRPVGSYIKVSWYKSNIEKLTKYLDE